MKVQNLGRNNPSFKGGMNNKLLLKSLEKISEHGTTFSAGVSFIMPLTIRPLAILSTPNVEKENKQYACANSICSGLIKFGMLSAVALPIENAVKKIDKNPEKYLKPQTLRTLNHHNKKIIESQSYRLGTQIMKLGTGFITAIPKSMLTIALIPIIMDKLFSHKFSAKVYNRDEKHNKINSSKISFKAQITDKIAKGLGKILDNTRYQKFITKHQNEEKNIAKHLSAGTDILLTSSFAVQTAKTDKIKENRKRALIYNNILATGITLSGGYSVDKIIRKKTEPFIKKFSEIHKNDPKLQKYIQGINIARPALIFAGIYYCILPVFSTYFAEKIDKFARNDKSN